jgi:magnesium transporter
MIFAYSLDGNNFERRSDVTAEVIQKSLWIDLKEPTADEESLIEASLGIGIPTREDMREIEASSRLYVEQGYKFMTVSLLCHADSEEPVIGNVTFILGTRHLITVRYDEPKSFVLYVGHVCGINKPQCPDNSEGVFKGLLETVIDRSADIMERRADEIDKISTAIFRRRRRPRSRNSYQVTLCRIGHEADVLSKIRESLATLSRMLLFLSSDDVQGKLSVHSMVKDVQSINDYASFLVNKVTFLLDTLVGMVSIEQNDIIKLFSVIAVVMLPPTLIASIYGMNFALMPELKWQYGYPLALLLMILSAILPYLFFKWRRWF